MTTGVLLPVCTSKVEVFGTTCHMSDYKFAIQKNCTTYSTILEYSKTDVEYYAYCTVQHYNHRRSTCSNWTRPTKHDTNRRIGNIQTPDLPPAVH
jgi:hypothetical protein